MRGGNYQGCDATQLLGTVIGKIERVCDARPHTRIALEESIHAVPIAGEDNHEVVLRILHDLEQNFNRLVSMSRSFSGR